MSACLSADPSLILCATICSDLGMVLAEDKSAEPSTQMEWLGFEVDSVKMTIRVPDEKLSDILIEAGEWENKEKASKKELQSIAGKFAHISQCIPHSRKFMNRILAGVRAAHHTGWIRVSEDLRRDIRWFIEFAEVFNGVLLIPVSLPKVVLECDACLQGAGGFGVKGYYTVQFPIQTQIDHHISRLEALNVVMCIKTLVPNEQKCVCVLVRTDNSAAAAVLMNGKTKDPVLAVCARVLAMHAALRQWQVIVTHVPGVSLILADALSRYTLSARYRDIVRRRTKNRSLVKVRPNELSDILYSHV